MSGCLRDLALERRISTSIANQALSVVLVTHRSETLIATSKQVNLERVEHG